jgi:hypothetical protein
MNHEATTEQRPTREAPASREWENSEWFREWLAMIHQETVDAEAASS